MKYDESFKAEVQEALRSGMTVEECVRKFGVSQYFARLWKGELYKTVDIDSLVRARYRPIVRDCAVRIEDRLSRAMTQREVEAMSDETWGKFQDIIKDGLYDTAAEIEKVR